MDSYGFVWNILNVAYGQNKLTLVTNIEHFFSAYFDRASLYQPHLYVLQHRSKIKLAYRRSAFSILYSLSEKRFSPLLYQYLMEGRSIYTTHMVFLFLFPQSSHMFQPIFYCFYTYSSCTCLLPFFFLTLP